MSAKATARAVTGLLLFLLFKVHAARRLQTDTGREMGKHLSMRCLKYPHPGDGDWVICNCINNKELGVFNASAMIEDKWRSVTEITLRECHNLKLDIPPIRPAMEKKFSFTIEDTDTAEVVRFHLGEKASNVTVRNTGLIMPFMSFQELDHVHFVNVDFRRLVELRVLNCIEFVIDSCHVTSSDLHQASVAIARVDNVIIKNNIIPTIPDEAVIVRDGRISIHNNTIDNVGINAFTFHHVIDISLTENSIYSISTNSFNIIFPTFVNISFNFIDNPNMVGMHVYPSEVTKISIHHNVITKNANGFLKLHFLAKAYKLSIRDNIFLESCDCSLPIKKNRVNNGSSTSGRSMTTNCSPETFLYQHSKCLSPQGLVHFSAACRNPCFSRRGRNFRPEDGRVKEAPESLNSADCEKSSPASAFEKNLAIVIFVVIVVTVFVTLLCTMLILHFCQSCRRSRKKEDRTRLSNIYDARSYE